MAILELNGRLDQGTYAIIPPVIERTGNSWVMGNGPEVEIAGQLILESHSARLYNGHGREMARASESHDDALIIIRKILKKFAKIRQPQHRDATIELLTD